MTIPDIPQEHEDDPWAHSVAESNQDGLRGGAAAPEGHGGPFEGDRTEEQA